MKLDFQNVWENKSDKLIQEIIDTWVTNNILPKEHATTERAHQVVFIVRNIENNKIMAVSTVRKKLIPWFKNYFYLYRFSVVPQYRSPGIMPRLYHHTFTYFSSKYQKGQDVIGFYIELQNKDLQKVNYAVLVPEIYFVGFSEKKYPCYVSYYEDAIVH